MSWLRDLLYRWLGIVSPSRAFANACNGTASEEELRFLNENLRDFAKLLDSFSEEERAMLYKTANPYLKCGLDSRLVSNEEKDAWR